MSSRKILPNAAPRPDLFFRSLGDHMIISASSALEWISSLS